jgi:hypothetical protein
MKNESEAMQVLQSLSVALEETDHAQKSPPSSNQALLSESGEVIYIPLPDFFKAPNRKAVLTIKNNAPPTNPVIRITEVAANWNYVDSTGTLTGTGSSRVSPSIPPGGTASLSADQNGCVRNLTFQVTVGIPEADQYVKLKPIAVPGGLGCIVTIKSGVGTST